MTFDVILTGCRPDPLGSYLKALAVLRLVAEQNDQSAKGYWKDDTFHLVSALDREHLVEFFAEEYAPTPIVGPWGARSGFFGGSSEKSAREALEAIETSTTPRFAAFRATILAARGCLRALKLSAKAKDDEKVALMAALRNALPEASLRWLDAAYVLGNSIRQRGFPIILGTGGNEGSQGFSSTFMHALLDMGVGAHSIDRGVIEATLLATRTMGAPGAATGQFSPGETPGFNQGPGFSGGRSTSACDMVFTFEGAASWVSGPTKRNGSSGPGRLASPFTVRNRAIGFNSEGADEVKSRGEIWAPIWVRPTSWHEIAALLGEGRAQWRGRAARTAVDLAKASANLGVERGVRAFERFAILDRNGKSYFAVSAGRFDVFARSQADLMRETDAPLDRIDRQIRRLKDQTPKRLLLVRRAVDAAIFDALRIPDARRTLAVLRAIGRTEAMLATMDGGRTILKTPTYGTTIGWLLGSADCVELRIAAAVASIEGDREVGPFRANVVPVEPRRPFAFTTGTGQVAWQGNSLATRMASVLRRRMIDYERLTCDRLPLRSVLAVAPEDVAAFLEGRTDDALLEELLFALTWIDWRIRDKLGDVRRRWRKPIEDCALPAEYRLFKSVLNPRQSHHEVRIVPLVLAGKVDAATEAATMRLRVAGMRPVRLGSRSARRLPNPSVDPVRLAASLLIPTRDDARLLESITYPEQRNEA